MGRVKKEEDLGPEADENWKSKDPKALAYEIATFMGGTWPTRPVRKVQLSLDGVPTVRFGIPPALISTSSPPSLPNRVSLPAQYSPALCINTMHPAGRCAEAASNQPRALPVDMPNSRPALRSPRQSAVLPTRLCPLHTPLSKPSVLSLSCPRAHAF
jgi:hypothetical protein